MSTTVTASRECNSSGGGCCSGWADDWQNNNGSVLASNRYMLENQIECDVHFTLLPPGGETVVIGTHKYALISRSPVFFAMLSGPLSSCGSTSGGADNKTKEIRVTDISPAIFWQLLRYLYYEEIELTPDTVFAVLYAAKKYLIKSLSTRCALYLDSILGPENVCTFLENAFLYEDETALKKKCFNIIQHQSKRVFLSDAFFEMSKETLCQVLKTERLNVHEIDVFRASIHWAERKVSELNLAPTPANKRTVLGEALYLIHIPAMNVNEFTKIVVPTGVLDLEEENLLFRLMLGGEQMQNVPFPRNMRSFVSTRCDITYDGGFVRHTAPVAALFQGVPQRSKWSVSLYCDHSIKIQEIGFFGCMKGHVTITQNGYRKLDVSHQNGVQNIQFGDDLHLDAGLFSIGTDAAFAYSGDYFSRGVSNTMPSVTTDHDKVNILVRDASALCFLAYIVFVATDEIYFIENYYNDDSMV